MEDAELLRGFAALISTHMDGGPIANTSRQTAGMKPSETEGPIANTASEILQHRLDRDEWGVEGLAAFGPPPIDTDDYYVNKAEVERSKEAEANPNP